MNSLSNTLSRPIKVLYIHHVSTVGGSSISLRHFIQSFPPGTVDPYVLSPPGTAFELFKEADIKVAPIAGVAAFGGTAGVPLRGTRWLTLLYKARHLRSADTIRKAIAEYQPDIVHLNGRSLLHAAKVAKSAGVPVVMHARTVADPERRWIHNLSVSAINRYVDMMIAIDGSVRNSMPEVNRCKVVYNPLRLEQRSVVTESSPSTPSSELFPRRIRVTFLSLLLKCKGVWDLLEAAKLLRHRPDIIIQIAGGNSRPRQFFHSTFGKLCHLFGFVLDLETEMKKFIQRQSLQNTVVMLGYVQDVEPLLRDTDILVFPSHLNGPSRSVFEAGVYGIPSVMSMRDRVEDVVEHGVTGLIVPERDPAALAKALETLADDDNLRVQLGKNARRKYTSQFDPGKGAREVLEIYRTLI